ncbi:AAA family ATPase [Pantoea sp. Cy-639]|uniref:AAA family ATPase n=1 Tax=Pantoea sp. Cy-639 TaxID=2608360 RepID=UPI00141DDD95|nr:AAA family ATPase [Pantoea sp. Cy-639]
MDVQTDIRTWLLKQNDWLQEAADRILKKGGVDAADIAEICEILKTPAGQKATGHRTFDELTHKHNADDELRLVRISDIAGIENLEPRQPLEFAAANLTVIYGHNGSGKSSYTRILKKMAGKPRAVELKTNVFKDVPAQSKCSIVALHNGVEHSNEWQVGNDAIDLLRGVDIFDSEEAAHYLTAESTATYIPPIVGLFEKLATVVEQVREALDDEQKKLISALPALPGAYEGTPTKAIYGKLGTLAPAALTAALAWGEQDELQLGALNDRLKADDPKALAAQKRRRKMELQKIITDLEGGIKAFCEANLQSIRNLRKDASEKRQIAVEGAKVQSAVLDGVGTPTWRAMWNAAKLYSALPYPDREFPVTDEARCLLCHQELSAEAKHRLEDFETFVHSQLEADATTAEQLYTQSLEQLTAIPVEANLQTQCEAAELPEEWRTYLKDFWAFAAAARTALVEHELKVVAIAVQAQNESIERLNASKDQLELDAEQFDEDALGFDRVQAGRDKLAFEARKWVSQQAAAVRVEIERLKQVKAYDGWKGLAGSRGISLKAAEVAQAVVTEAYVERFNNELRALGATRIQVELVKTRTRNGKVLHQLQLKGVKNARSMPEGVLSEGERRIISLAAFLADVCDKPGVAPFVFDDPISSLDQDFEWSVACRLVELAKTRQVIVLTHRLSLYGILEDVARKVGEKWRKEHYRPMCIESYNGAAGHPADQATWNANTKSANNILIARLDVARKAGEAGGAVSYRDLAQGICSDFRKLVERSVEEDLLNQVVLRHRRSVTTDGRLRAVQILPEDCELIDMLMTKYSCYEHSQSAENPAFLPEAPELLQDLEALKAWREGLIKRRAQAA